MTRRRDQTRSTGRIILRPGRYSATIHGPARHVMPAVRQACGDSWSWDHAERALRVPIGALPDVTAALEAAGRTVRVTPRSPASVTRDVEPTLSGVLW